MSAVPVSAAGAPSRRPGRRAAAPATVGSLKRVRWAVRGTLLLGVAASVAANILHAQPHPVSQSIAAWPPVALLLTVELISRVPVHRKGLAAARLIAATTIAGIAAWVSYWHMVGVTARYGETGLSAYLLPLSVDGLVVVASISLVELSGRLRVAQTPPPTVQPAPHPTPSSTAPATTEPHTTAPPDRTPLTPADAAPPETPRGAPAPAHPTGRPGDHPEPAADHDTATHEKPGAGDPPADEGGPSTDGPRRSDAAGSERPGGGARQRRPRGAATRNAVIDAYRRDPALHPTAIAGEVGTSERTVRRYLGELRANADTPLSSGYNGAQHIHRGDAARAAESMSGPDRRPEDPLPPGHE